MSGENAPGLGAASDGMSENRVLISVFWLL